MNPFDNSFKDYDRNVIFDRNNDMAIHRKKLNIIRNRKIVLSEQDSVIKKQHKATDFNNHFQVAFGDRYLFERLTNISNKNISPSKGLESRVLESQKKVIKYQHDLKDRLIKKENSRILKRLEESAPFMSVKQIDSEFINQHSYLINNIKRVKNNNKLSNVLANSVKLPMLSNNGKRIMYETRINYEQPFERIGQNDLNSRVLNTEI